MNIDFIYRNTKPERILNKRVLNAAEGNALSGMLTKKVRLSSPTMWEDATMRIRVVTIYAQRLLQGQPRLET